MLNLLNHRGGFGSMYDKRKYEVHGSAKRYCSLCRSYNGYLLKEIATPARFKFTTQSKPLILSISVVNSMRHAKLAHQLVMDDSWYLPSP